MAFGDRKKPMKRTGFKPKKKELNSGPYSRSSTKKVSKQAAKPRKKVANRSAKTADRDRYYSKLRRVWLTGRSCEMSLGMCTGQATEVQHLKKRSVASGLVLYVPNFMAACNACHSWVTAHTNEAEALGLMFKSWQTLPKDQDMDSYSRCGSCGSPIFWAHTKNKKSIPLDADADTQRPKPVSGGNIRESVPGSEMFPEETPAHLFVVDVLHQGDKPDPGSDLFLSHFVTCPDRNSWRRP